MVQYGLQRFPKGNSIQKLRLQDLCLRDGSTSKDLNVQAIPERSKVLPPLLQHPNKILFVCPDLLRQRLFQKQKEISHGRPFQTSRGKQQGFNNFNIDSICGNRCLFPFPEPSSLLVKIFPLVQQAFLDDQLDDRAILDDQLDGRLFANKNCSQISPWSGDIH